MIPTTTEVYETEDTSEAAPETAIPDAAQVMIDIAHGVLAAGFRGPLFPVVYSAAVQAVLSADYGAHNPPTLLPPGYD